MATKKSAVADYLSDALADWARLRVRAMFGGFGVYREELMFALIADETVYLKADAQSAPTYDEAGCPAFEYSKNGKTFAMSYRQLPETALDDAEELRRWVELAWGAALRQRKPAKKRR